MPITIPQQQTIVQYVTNSSQTQYTFDFYAPLNTDMQVYYQAPNAIPIPDADILALNVDYTVAFNSDPTTGGTITLLFTPVTGYYLTINRNVAPSLTTNFADATTFNGANLDAALDRLLLLIQQNLNYILERNLSYIINTYLPDATPYTQLPPLSNMQIWQGTGSGIIAVTLEENPDVSTLRSQLANNAPVTDGATLVGYYDTSRLSPTTVDQFLNSNSVSAKDSSISANTITIALSANYSLQNGNSLAINVANTNTSATTLSINSGTPISVIKYNVFGAAVALTGSELSSGLIYEFIYISTTNKWLLVNPNPIPFFVGASVTNSTNQTLSSSSPTVVVFDTVEYDPYSMFVSASNSFKCLKAGYYQISADLRVSAAASGEFTLTFYKNGSIVHVVDELYFTTSIIQNAKGVYTLNLNVNDTVNLSVVNATGSNVILLGGGFFQVIYIGT